MLISFLQEFYFGLENSTNGGVILFKLKHSAQIVPFVPILKCANKGITENLIQMSSTIDWTTDFITSREEYDRKFSTYLSSSGGDRVRSFTFVRDPIQHFISGFVHSVFVTFPIAPLNESQVQQYLLDILLQRPTQLDMEEYMFPMSRTYLRFPVDIVGRLESFSEDWEREVVPAYGIAAPYDYRLGMHATSANHPAGTGAAASHSASTKGERNHGDDAAIDRDPLRARESLVALLRSQPHYLRALCHLLLLDYVCLPEYELPLACAFLQPLRTEIQREEKERRSSDALG